MTRIITILFAAFVLASCPMISSAKGASKAAETAVFTLVPKMTCENCVRKIQTNLRFEKGVTEITPDLKSQTVTIKYKAGKNSPGQLAKAFKKIGYTATPVEEKKEE
ncbi:MAG: heavy-metal-associated domain-containing protein [Muribaculaceae bacterium]|nr:heavy-metal-associated domain-containing protein [Muribaculaceae bacterium]